MPCCTPLKSTDSFPGSLFFPPKAIEKRPEETLSLFNRFCRPRVVPNFSQIDDARFPRARPLDLRTIRDYSHSRPQRPRSFWSVPRIETSGRLQNRKSATRGGLPYKRGRGCSTEILKRTPKRYQIFFVGVAPIHFHL